MRSSIKRNDLECDVGELGSLQDMPELCTHDGTAAHSAAQHRLIDDSPEFERILVPEDIPPGHANLHAPLDLVTAGEWQRSTDQGARIVLSLEQPGNEQRLVVPFALRFTLEADEGH